MLLRCCCALFCCSNDIGKSGSKPSVFDTFYFQMCFAPQRRALFRHRNRRQKWSEHQVFWHFLLRNVLRATTACTFSTSQLQKWSEADVFCTFLLPNVLRATTACTFSTSQLPKVVRDRRVLTLFTSKCASRHNGVHFFHISTSKSRPKLTCFDTFYFQMCFAPQRRALFPHLNFQKWSETDVFWHFLLQNVLRATTACNFSFLICPDVSAPAALASLLFDPPEPQNTGKTQCFATSLPFRAPASSLFWLSPSLIFSLLTFYTSEFLPGSASSWLCCFSSVHIVGTLVSKLPSIIFGALSVAQSMALIRNWGPRAEKTVSNCPAAKYSYPCWT